MQLTKYGYPRRNDILAMTTTELLILRVIAEVESMGAHTLLTDAVVLLSQAKDKISDFVELDYEATKSMELPPNESRDFVG